MEAALRSQLCKLAHRREHSHGGGLPGAVVAEERRDLVLVEVHAQPVHRQLLPRLVDLHQVADGDASPRAGRRILQIVYKKKTNAPL